MAQRLAQFLQPGRRCCACLLCGAQDSCPRSGREGGATLSRAASLQEWSTEMAGQLEPWHILVVSALANARQLKHDAYVVHKIPGRLYTDRTVAEFRKVRRRRRLGCACARGCSRKLVLPWHCLVASGCRTTLASVGMQLQLQQQQRGRACGAKTSGAQLVDAAAAEQSAGCWHVLRHCPVGSPTRHAGAAAGWGGSSSKRAGAAPCMLLTPCCKLCMPQTLSLRFAGLIKEERKALPKVGGTVALGCFARFGACGGWWSVTLRGSGVGLQRQVSPYHTALTRPALLLPAAAAYPYVPTDTHCLPPYTHHNSHANTPASPPAGHRRPGLCAVGARRRHPGQADERRLCPRDGLGPAPLPYRGARAARGV